MARKDWGQLGPAMRALPNDRWRDFVYHLVNNPGYGAQSRAARLAGFGEGSTPTVVAKIAHGLVMCTFTPMLGLSEVVMNYLPEGRMPS